ncbi:hypothetical protein BN85411810 [Alteracholeplasma palmae J233]|uniref:GLUG domain-containing protein n=1 Tax=Alteracholeplasma palmae (strain ATCC 49389 / J233) TaxID=1318466 RepID=U4KLL5_ALTPJ|nr:hypothetical protein [Alteracholeplasma palmae]CCV64758.1 hypothetical protein BN85411810 [Alteracholeplasma palmae J233]
MEFNLLQGGEQELNLEIEYNGYYKFQEHDKNNKKKIVSVYDLDNLVYLDFLENNKIYLEGNKKYKVKIKYDNTSDFGSGIIKITSDYQKIDQDRELKFGTQSTKNELFAINIENETAYEFSVSSTYMRINLFNSDKVLMKQSLINEIDIHLKMGKYYILIENINSTDLKANFKFGRKVFLETDTSVVINSNNNEKIVGFKNNEAGNFFIKLDNYEKIEEYSVINTNNTVLETNGGILILVYLEKNSEIMVRVKAQVNVRAIMVKAEENYKWEIDDKEISGSEIRVKTGTKTKIKLKVLDNYMEQLYPISSEENSYSFADNIMVIHEDAKINERIVIQGISNNSPIYLYVYVMNKFEGEAYNVYNGEEFYGIKWNDAQAASSFDLNLEFNISGRWYDFPTVHNFSSRTKPININEFVKGKLSGEIGTVIIRVKWITLNKGNIYNIFWDGFNGLSQSEKRQQIEIYDQTIGTHFEKGDGSQQNPYIVSNFRNLNNINKLKNEENIYYYEIKNDIIFPSGYIVENSFIRGKFKGVIRGNRKKISGVKIIITDLSLDYYGFIEENYGTIYYLTLEKSGIESKVKREIHNDKFAYIGMFTGINYGTIMNCIYNKYDTSITYNIYQYVGGIAGENRRLISDCKVIANSGFGYFGNTGGIVGYNAALAYVENSSFFGTIFVGSAAVDVKRVTGGIVAVNDGSVLAAIDNNIQIYYAGEKSESRTLQPIIGIFIGENYRTDVYSKSDLKGAVHKGNLQTVTWETGTWWWKETHYFDQALYAKGDQIGKQLA